MPKLTTFALLAALGCAVHSQTMPTEGDVTAQQKQIQELLNGSALGSPSGQAQIRAQMGSNAAAMNATSTLKGANQPVSKSTAADFMNLARPGTKNPAVKKAASDLMVFVSLSMPEKMLMQYAAQAKRFDAVLILRGFVDDKLSATRDTLAKLNASGATWQISPDPFKTFKIDKVPAIVLATAESASVTEEGCAQPDTYTSIFGDIAIYDALDKMSLRGQAKISALAKARLVADRAAGQKG